MLPQCCYLRRRRAERRKEKDPPKCSTLSRKKKECFGAQGARLELLTTQTLNQEGGSARAPWSVKSWQAARKSSLRREDYMDRLVTPPTRRPLPACKQALIAQKCQIYPRSDELQKMTVNANSTQRSQLSCWAQPEALLPWHQKHNIL